MCLDHFLVSLRYFLIEKPQGNDCIIRRHSRKLEQLGEISFPLSIKNWHHLLNDSNLTREMVNIFDYTMKEKELCDQIEILKERSKNWSISIGSVKIVDNNVHLFLNRSSYLLKTVFDKVQKLDCNYGSSETISKQYTLNFDSNIDIQNGDFTKIDLTTLRLLLLRDVCLNLLNYTTKPKSELKTGIIFTTKSQADVKVILCGPVLNEKGMKDNQTTADGLLNKRTSDMRMMAQHKYGVQVKSNSSWEIYFKKLGKAAVTVEMLSNKPQKPLKVTLHDLQTANKGASFIFYNCARLSALFKEFDKRVTNHVYPNLPDLSDIDFSLLNQPEEWELFYVYILQFPILLKNCVRDIENGILNPQYLISFLSNLSSVFSVYYRRVRILTEPRDHLFAVLHARIYLVKAVQCVLHNALSILNIEPITEM